MDWKNKSKYEMVIITQLQYNYEYISFKNFKLVWIKSGVVGWCEN